MLPLTLFSIYRQDYSFSSGKKCLLSERFYIFLGRRVESNSCLIKPLLISTFNPQEVLNK